MTIPNGLAWNTGDTAFYHIDTSKRRVDRYDFDLESGAVSGKRTIISVPESEGAPDGMVADEEGMLWIAMWGGRQVCRYNPITGGKLASVPIPANRVSCCAFGGADMSELFVTTAMDEDGGGEVYIVKTGVRGAAVFEYT
jgi:sugar lactone lactonase YvrE